MQNPMTTNSAIVPQCFFYHRVVYLSDSTQQYVGRNEEANQGKTVPHHTTRKKIKEYIPNNEMI